MATTLWQQWSRRVYHILQGRKRGARQEKRRPWPVLRLEELEVRLNPAALAPFRLVGPADVLASDSSNWAWDANGQMAQYLAAYRTAIQNAANFGPSGTVHTPITTESLSTIDSSTLTPGLVSGFIAPYWSNDQSLALDQNGVSYAQDVVNYFKSGGNVVLLQDDTGHDAIGALLGIPTTGNSDGTVSNGGSPLFSGPFGTASNVTQTGSVGQLNASDVLDRGGALGAVNSSGQVTAAFWNQGQYTDPNGNPVATSGRLLIVADVDMWSTYGTANYSTLNDNARFALNGTAFLVGADSSATAPQITTQPASQTVNAGQGATFVAAATGNPAPTVVQWQISTDGGATFSNLSNGDVYSGVTDATLNITASAPSLNGAEYRAVFSNAAGSAASNPATLTVAQATVSVTDAGGAYTGAAFPATATVTANGNPVLADEIDQQQSDVIAPIAGGFSFGQTFVPSDDNVSAAAVQLFYVESPGDLTISLYASPPGDSQGAPLATGTVAYATGGLTTVAFDSPVAVTPGQTYYLSFSTTSLVQLGGDYNGYAPGECYINGSPDSRFDYAFQEYSRQPAPTTLAYYTGTYSDPSQLADQTPLGGAPTEAGSYTVLASFAGNAQYALAAGLASFSITPAPLDYNFTSNPAVGAYTLLDSGGILEIVDSANPNSVLASQPLADTSAVQITGQATDTLTIDLDSAYAAVPVAYTGGGNVIVNLPAGVTDAVLAAGTAAGTETLSSAGFAPTTFDDPSGSLTLNAAGNSVVQIGAPDAAFGPAGITLSGLASDTFRLTADDALPAASDLTVTTATLDLNGHSDAIYGLSGSGNVTKSAGGRVTLTVGGGGGTFSGVLADGGGLALSLVKTGAGTEVLSGANTYTGATTVNGGDLVAGAGAAFGNTSSLNVNGGTVQLNGYNVTVPYLSGTGGVIEDNAATDATLELTGSNFGPGFSGILQDGAGGGALALHLASGSEYFGGANTYTGGTTIDAGGYLNVGPGVLPGNVVLNGGLLAFDGQTAYTFAGSISGSGDVRVGEFSAPTLTLSGSNSFTGQIEVKGGTLAAGSATAFGDAVLASLSTGATLDLNGYDVSIGFLAGDGGTVLNNGSSAATLTVGDAANVTYGFGGVIEDGASTLALTKSGHNDEILSGANTYSGATTVNGGTLQLGAADAIGSSSSVDVAAGATLDLNGYSDAIDGLNGSGTVTSGAAGAVTLTVGSAGGDGTFGGVIQDGGGTVSLAKTGRGTQSLSGADTYSGGTSVTGGVLSISDDGNLGAASGGVTLDGGTLLFTATVISARAITLGGSGGTLHVLNNSDSLFLSGPITGAGNALTIAGPGPVHFSGASNSFGQLTIDSGSILFIESATSSGTLGATGDVIDNGTLEFHFPTDVAVANDISGSGVVDLAGGSMVLSGANSYQGGTQISTGTLSVAEDDNLGDASGGVTFYSNGTLQATGTFATNRTLTFSSAFPGATIDVLAGATLTDTGLITGAGPLTKTGAGQLDLVESVAPFNDFTGGLTISGGVLSANGSDALGASNTLTLDGGTFQFVGAFNITQPVVLTANGGTVDTQGGFGRLENVVSSTGAGTLTKIGTGILDLVNANTYTGDTLVSQGTLYADTQNGYSSTGSGNVSVSAGAKLGGSGTISGGVTVDGTLTPAGSIAATGVLNTGSLTLNSDSTFHALIGGNAAGNYDQDNVTGTVRLGGATLDPASSGGYLPRAGDEYVLISNDGTDAVSGTFAGLAQGALVSSDFLGGGLSAYINYQGGDGNDVVIDVAPPDTVTVTSAADSGAGTLRAALAGAHTGETIDFAASFTDSAVRIIDLTSAGLTIGVNVTIQNDLGTGPVVIDGGGQFTVFTVNSGVTASLSGLTIQNGHSANGGGVYNGGTLTVSDCTFSNNTASGGQGGGISNDYGTLTVSDSTFSGNSAEAGGGIVNSNGTATISNSTFSGNSASDGAAIESSAGNFNNPGSLTVSDSTFSGNSANTGGAVYIQGAATVSDSTFSGNFATGGVGGGIYLQIGSATVSDSTFSGNSAADNGGGIYNSSANNLSLNGNVVVGNIGSGGAANDIAGVALQPASGDNVVGVDSTGSLSNGANGNQVGVSLAQAALSPLGNHGGPTQTLLLLPGSVAINAGVTHVSASTDQRGFARPVGLPSDAGAVQTTQIAFVSPDARSVGAGALSGDITIQFTVANGSPIAGAEIDLTSGSATGAFFDVSGVALPQTAGGVSYVVTASDGTAAFQYEDTTAGAPTLTAADAAHAAVPTSQTETVTAGAAAQIAFASPALTNLTAGVHSGGITVQATDANGNPVAGEQIDLTTTSARGVFHDANGGALQQTGDGVPYVVTGTDGRATFQYKDTVAGAPTLSATDVTTFLSSATQTETVVPGQADHIAFVTDPQTFAAGTNSGYITVQVEDVYNNPVDDAGDFIAIRTTGNGHFFPDSQDDVAITGRGTGGAGQASFIYNDPTAGTPTLTASSADLGSQTTQQETVNAGAPGRIVFVAPAVTGVTEGAQSAPITVQVLDANGNPLSGQTVSLSSSDGTGVFYDLTGAHVLTSVTSGADGKASFLYEDSAAGSVTLTATDGNGVVNGGFETGDFSGWIQSGNTGATGVGSDASLAHSGNHYAELGPVGSLGYLTQSIPTVAGRQYTFSWWLRNDGGTPNEFQASWNGAVIFDQTNMAPQAYTLYSFTETATSASTPIQFGFRQDPAYFQLDDVSVTGASTDGGGSAVVEGTSNIQVADALLTETSFAPPTAIAGVAFGPTTVFTFTDANPQASLATYTATVHTGDGNTYTSAANPDVVQVAADPNVSGQFDVRLSHTYVAALNGQTFSVSVSDAGGADPISDSTSDFSVDAIPTISGDPTSLTVNAGASASFTASADGNPAPSVLWKAEAPGAEDFSALSDGGVYSGTGTGTLSISNVTGLNGYHFEAFFSNAAGEATSHPAVLTVASQLAVTSQPQTLTAGVVSGPITLHLEDEAGNRIGTDGDLRDVINLHSSSAGGVFYSDAQGTTVITSVALGADGSAAFYYRDTAAGSPTLTATDATHTTLTAGTQTETVSPGPASTITFGASSPALTADGPSTVTLTVRDAEGNRVAAGEQIVLATSDATGLFVNGGNSGNSITVTTLANGTATFTYQDAHAGAVTLKATDAAVHLVQTQAETVAPGVASTVAISPASTTLTAGVASAFTVTVKDAEGNVIPGASVVLATSHPATGVFTDLATQHSGAKITVTTGADGAAAFVYLDADAGSVTLTASDGVTATQIDAIRQAPTAVTLASVGSLNAGQSFTLGASVTTSVGGVTFEILDANGAIVYASPAEAIQGGTATTGLVATVGLGAGQYEVEAFYHDPAGNFADALAGETLTVQAGAKNVVAAQPGQTVTQTVVDPNTKTITTVSLTLGQGDMTQGSITASDLPAFTPSVTPAGVVTVASFDIKQLGLTNDATASATVTLVIPGTLPPGTIPALLFQTTAASQPVAFQGQFQILQGPNEIIVTVTFNSTSTPTLGQLTGTVFTVAASTPSVTTVTAVGAATASTAPGQFAVQGASFQSTSQLTLPLAAAQASQVSTSRSTLSATDAGGGGETAVTDAQADALIQFLFEKLNFRPNMLLHLRLDEVIRLWLGQVSLAPSAQPAGAQPDTAAESLAALDFHFGGAQSAFGPREATGAAGDVAVQPWVEGGKQAPDAPKDGTPAYAWAIPMVGLGLGVHSARRKRRQQENGRRN